MIRFILVVIVLVLHLILGIPVLAILWIVGKFNKRASDILSLRIVQNTFKFMLWLSGTKVTVIGEENVPTDKPVLFVGNHRSFFDILITYSRVRNLTGYVAKKEMLKAPLLCTWMKRLYCLFLDRSSAKEGLKTILTCIEYVKQGISICIFPEGTRNKGEELSLLPFQEGSFKVAEKSGCPIITMSINNANGIFEKQFPKIRPTHVILEYGKPIYMGELEKEERKHIGAYCQNIIQDTINRNSKLV